MIQICFSCWKESPSEMGSFYTIIQMENVYKNHVQMYGSLLEIFPKLSAKPRLYEQRTVRSKCLFNKLTHFNEETRALYFERKVYGRPRYTKRVLFKYPTQFKAEINVLSHNTKRRGPRVIFTMVLFKWNIHFDAKISIEWYNIKRDDEK